VGEGMEDWKKKYLHTSNKLQEVRLEVQDLRAQLQRHKKALLKEVGSEDCVERALLVADDPSDAQWKGRATQIAQLQRQVRDMKEQIRRHGGEGDSGADGADASSTPQRPRRARADNVSEKERANLAQVADRRREEFDRLQEECERLRAEHAEGKKKREALKSRSRVLETNVSELKNHVQTLVQKSDNDDHLVASLQRQLENSRGDPCELDALRRQRADLQAQLERQAQMVMHLRQKSFAASFESGSTRLGPNAESTASARELIDRVRFLEAENAKKEEQVRILSA